MTYPTTDDETDLRGLTEGTIQLYAPNAEASIAMHAASGVEMIRVTQDGFYVRGQRVPADDKEAEAVYNAFKQWLAWATLQQRR